MIMALGHNRMKTGENAQPGEVYVTPGGERLLECAINIEIEIAALENAVGGAELAEDDQPPVLQVFQGLRNISGGMIGERSVKQIKAGCQARAVFQHIRQRNGLEQPQVQLLTPHDFAAFQGINGQGPAVAVGRGHDGGFQVQVEVVPQTLGAVQFPVVGLT